MNWELTGRAWLVGDDIGIDSHIMTMRAVRERIFDPDVLSGLIFEESRPDITAGAARGDVILAGDRFAHGNPHVNGWIGLRARGLGVICRSISRGGYRNSVNAGCPLLIGDTSLAMDINPDDTVTANFRTGEVRLSSGAVYRYEPLPRELLEIVELGGSAGWTRVQLARRVEQTQSSSGSAVQ